MSDYPGQLRPNAADVARRLVVLKHVIAYALTMPPRDVMRKVSQKWSAEELKQLRAEAENKRDEFWQPLRAAELWQHLSPAERELAGCTLTSMTARQQMNASWRIEAAQVLMWSLGLIPALPPTDMQCEQGILKQIPSADFGRFVASARLRPEATLDQARDEAELWHWRSRTRQLIQEGREFPDDAQMRAAGLRSFDDIVRMTARRMAAEGRFAPIQEDFPARSKAYRELSDAEWSEVRSITMERHFALNWLCGYAPGNAWDETPTET